MPGGNICCLPSSCLAFYALLHPHTTHTGSHIWSRPPGRPLITLCAQQLAAAVCRVGAARRVGRRVCGGALLAQRDVLE
eukprot:350592-Chlamydomonas_euryale.AAC.4